MKKKQQKPRPRELVVGRGQIGPDYYEWHLMKKGRGIYYTYDSPARDSMHMGVGSFAKWMKDSHTWWPQYKMQPGRDMTRKERTLFTAALMRWL